MFQRLRAFFGKKEKDQGEVHAPSGGQDPYANLLWLEPSDTPLGVRALDCRPVAFGMLCFTKERAVAQRYNELRLSSGEQVQGQAPLSPLKVPCDLRYPHNGTEVPDGCAFRAECMEDKWDAFLFKGYLYLTRSWTGELVYKAKIDFAEDAVQVSEIEANDTSCDHSPQLAVRQLDFLIRSHLTHLPVAHPVPESVPPEPRQIALYSFTTYGRRGLFASYDDTTAGKPWFFAEDDGQQTTSDSAG